MLEVPALKIQQRDVVLLVTALPLGELRKHAKVDLYRPDNPEGYQRPLVERRLAEIAKYIIEGDGILPTSILVCVREGDLNAPYYVADGDVGGFAQRGTVRIPDGATLWVVDGQHRHYGVNRAYERNGVTELAEYPFPVTLMMGVDQYTEMVHFSTINTEQRKMPTDIVDRHMVMKAEREGLDMIGSGRRGEKNYLRAKATRITDAMNVKPGPWCDQISIPGVPGRDHGLVRQHAIVASLEPSLKDPWLAARTEDEVAELLARYWRALSRTWPEAFEAPDDFRVQATVGVYSLHSVFPTVIQFCLSEGGGFTEDNMHHIWDGTGITANFWRKIGGDPYTVGTGMASIRLLAQYLRDQLPRATTVTI